MHGTHQDAVFQGGETQIQRCQKVWVGSGHFYYPSCDSTAHLVDVKISWHFDTVKIERYIALHDANLARNSLDGSVTGVFVGIAANDFSALMKSSASVSVYACNARVGVHPCMRTYTSESTRVVCV